MDSKKKMTGMMIHGFAVAHAVAAALLAQTLVGDEAVLTALTIAMIIAVARMNGADWDTGAACIYRTELATCTEKTSHLAGDFPPLRRRRLPVQKAGPIL